MDFPQLFFGLTEMGYTGPITFETFSTRVVGLSHLFPAQLDLISCSCVPSVPLDIRHLLLHDPTRSLYVWF